MRIIHLSLLVVCCPVNKSCRDRFCIHSACMINMRYEKEEHIILCDIASKRLNLPCNTVYGFEQNEEKLCTCSAVGWCCFKIQPTQNPIIHLLNKRMVYFPSICRRGSTNTARHRNYFQGLIYRTSPPFSDNIHTFLYDTWQTTTARLQRITKANRKNHSRFALRTHKVRDRCQLLNNRHRRTHHRRRDR